MHSLVPGMWERIARTLTEDRLLRFLGSEHLLQLS